VYSLLVGDVTCDTDTITALRRVKSKLGALQCVRTALVCEKDRPFVLTRMQVVFNAKHQVTFDRAIHETVMTHALRAEKLGPGGFDRCIELVLEKLGAPGGSLSGLCVPQLVSQGASAMDVEKIVRVHTSRARARTGAMLQRALELAGYGGRIIIEKTHSTTPSVELVRGYTFDLEAILPLDASFVRPRAFCIDGFIEEVAEIHHLLEASAEAREPCVLFVRGVSDDVKHTLKTNYDRGSLRVLPLGARFDLEGMNTLVDLAVVTGADLVSSLKGDLISSIKFHEAPYVDQVTVFRGCCIVVNAPTHTSVAAHVANLRSRRQEEKIDDKGRLFDKRIKSLSPNHVIIRLPGDKDFVTNSQAIDNALRAIKSAVDFGVIETGDLVATEMAAQVHADRCIRSLLDLGACLS
jgi:hypothetical protein